MPESDLEKAAKFPWAEPLLYAARFLAVVFWISTGALAYRIVGHDLRLWKTTNAGNHVVVCGLGPVGGEVVRQMIKTGYKVVVVDRGEDTAAVNGALESGASVIVGDPADKVFLGRAGAASARLSLPYPMKTQPISPLGCTP